MIGITFVALIGVALAAQAADQSTVSSRGAHAMGFDQDKTQHHFLLYEDGGAIDISVKDASDGANRAAIRAHLPHIGQMLGAGDFSAPHFIHATDVPGTAVLARLKDRVTWRYRETANGGRLDVITSDREALSAVHAFLRFQIQDHRTGDPLTVSRRPGDGGHGRHR